MFLSDAPCARREGYNDALILLESAHLIQALPACRQSLCVLGKDEAAVSNRVAIGQTYPDTGHRFFPAADVAPDKAPGTADGLICRIAGTKSEIADVHA